MTAGPNGCSGYWSYAERGPYQADEDFIRQMINDLEARYPVDRSRIYVVGASAGTWVAYRLACDMADEIAAIASVAGTMRLSDACQPGKPVSILEMHGTLDSVHPWQGGGPHLAFGVEEVIHRWVALEASRRPRYGVTALVASTCGSTRLSVDFTSGSGPISAQCPVSQTPMRRSGTSSGACLQEHESENMEVAGLGACCRRDRMRHRFGGAPALASAGRERHAGCSAALGISGGRRIDADISPLRAVNARTRPAGGAGGDPSPVPAQGRRGRERQPPGRLRNRPQVRHRLSRRRGDGGDRRELLERRYLLHQRGRRQLHRPDDRQADRAAAARQSSGLRRGLLVRSGDGLSSGLRAGRQSDRDRLGLRSSRVQFVPPRPAGVRADDAGHKGHQLSLPGGR